MKKVAQAYSEYLKPARVYLDDLEEIVGILRETCDEVIIQAGDCLLDDLNELGQLRKEVLHDLKISGSQPDVSVDMRHSQIWLYISEDTPKSRGLFEKIKEILVRCKRPFAGLLQNTFLMGTALAFTFCGIICAIVVKSCFLIVCFAFLFSLSILWNVYGFQERSNRYTIVVLKHRIDNPNFLGRNRDKIILMIISAFLGALVTYFLTLVL